MKLDLIRENDFEFIWKVEARTGKPLFFRGVVNKSRATVDGHELQAWSGGWTLLCLVPHNEPGTEEETPELRRRIDFERAIRDLAGVVDTGDA